MSAAFTYDSTTDSAVRGSRPRSYSFSDSHDFDTSLPHSEAFQLRSIRNSILSDSIPDDMVLVNNASRYQYFGEDFNLQPNNLLTRTMADNRISSYGMYPDEFQYERDISGSYISSFPSSDEYEMQDAELIGFYLDGSLDAENLLEDLYGYEATGKDFLYFVYDLFLKQLITLEECNILSAITARYPHLSPQWLKDNPKFDYQGIPWYSLSQDINHCQNTLSAAREIRSSLYKENMDSAINMRTIEGSKFSNNNIFKFKHTFTTARPIFTHFQLRSVVCPVSKNEIFYSNGWDNISIQVLNPETGEIKNFCNSKDFVNPHFRHTRISAMAANSELVIAGGLAGEYIIKTLQEVRSQTNLDDSSELSVNDSYHSSGTCFEGVMTSDSNGITNNISLVSSEHAMSPHALFSSNDQYIRTLDITRNQVLDCFDFGWRVNCSDYNRLNSNLRVFVGDSLDSIVMDAKSRDVVCKLRGHSDYGFACAWSPMRPLIATGNQDGTCRIYDLRNTSETLHVLETQLNDAIRSIHFDSTGKYLVFAEEIDHVTVFDVHSDFQVGQIINMWGEISGIGITDGADGGGQTITIGNFDRTVGGIFQFEREINSSIDNDFIF